MSQPAHHGPGGPKLLLLALVCLGAPASAEQPAPPQTAVTTVSTEQPAIAVDQQPAPPPADPFSRLKPVVPRDKLPPLSSVRIRDRREAEDRSRKASITVTVNTTPKGASVYYGGTLLGTTPISLSAQRGSTPFDVVIKRGGYMTLRTRLMRKVTRGYFFKLSPAKLN